MCHGDRSFVKFLIAFPKRKTSLQEALIVALHQLAIDLTHQFKCNTNRNQHGGSGEWE
jgi:hypothetical protein